MKRQKLFYILSVFLFFSLTPNSFSIELADSSTAKQIKGVYRVQLPDQQGEKIWIVDGLTIRREIFSEFLYGGNDERYPFIPKNEIWIDNAISAEEFNYTVAHELNERNLMTKGMSYDDAHNSSLALERKMRLADLSVAEDHESILNLVSPTDCDGIKQIKNLPDSISLQHIYRQFVRYQDGIAIWIVDGSIIRRDIFPDFGLSGNDLAYHFIPQKEIWIDGQISCEETEFSITCELAERKFMSEGMPYDDAYEKALSVVEKERIKASQNSMNHPPVTIPKILTRDLGTGSEK